MKKTIVGALLLSYSMASLADNAWVAGATYTNLSNDSDGVSSSVGAISATAGYKFNTGGNFHFIPEIGIGTGVADDSSFVGEREVVFGIDILLSVSAKVQYEWESGVYAFTAPAYLDIELVGDETDDTPEDNGNSGFGFGVGAGYQVSPVASVELGYSKFEGQTDVFTAGLRFNF